MPGGAVYRAGQFCRALGAMPSLRDLEAAHALLTDAQWRLFRAMSPRDQRHSVETLRLLRTTGHDDPDLAVAALLHDAAKGRIRLHERVFYVLLARFPGLLTAVARPDGHRLRGAMFRSLHHAEYGAELALAAGANERVADLIRGHHRPNRADPVAVALAEADDRA